MLDKLSSISQDDILDDLSRVGVMSKLLAEITSAIEMSGLSRYRISKDTGIDQAQLSRLMQGKCGLGFDALERLCDYLELEITVKPKQVLKPKRK
jgi:predicted XRE-type DNA-binding protein